MQIFTSLQDIPQHLRTPVLTMGNFDGVHRGHQHLFRLVQQRAKVLHGTSCVLTFEPHPHKVLFPDKEFFLINHLQEKLEIIRRIGIDLLFCVPFTLEFAASAPHDFVKHILIETLHVREIYVGENSRFGSRQAGTPEQLRQWGEMYGVAVTLVPPLRYDGEIISSTKIRQLLQAGDVARAAEFLARPYAVDGMVVRGTHRGTTLLGYPTANIDIQHELIPCKGVYICQVKWHQNLYPAVINIGTNPTFQREATIFVEVHLLDFHADLYGQCITVLFRKRLRDECKFATYQALMEQIARDVAEAQAFFEHQE